MRVIIAGGTGLVGRALAHDLAASEAEVILLSRYPERAGALPGGVRAERWDAHTAEGWGKLADGAEAIINLAGESIASGRWTTERKRRIQESRWHAGQAVTQAIEAARHRPAVVIQASAVGYYGPQGDELVTEQTTPGRDFLARVCVDWEAATEPVAAMGVRRAVIRTGVVLSTTGGALPRLVLPFRLFLGGPLGSGRQWFPWIHVVDELSAIRFLLENESAHGPFNLAAPQPITNQAFSAAVGRALRRPAFMPAPAPALRLLLGEMASVVLEGQRAVPQRLLEMGFTFQFSDADAALRALLR